MEPSVKSVFGTALPRSTTATPLLDALNELGIYTLPDEVVERYRSTKLGEVLDRKKPRFAKKLAKAVDEEQEAQARAWASANQMHCFEVRYYLGLWGIGIPMSHVVGWAITDNLPETAPAHVKEKTAQILAKVPQGRIETEMLRDEHQVYDPIVAVRLGAERYVFEVYEEPELERHMF